MVLEGRGRLYRRNKRVYIYVPAEITLDSAFPFTFEKGSVKIRIDTRNRCLIIEQYDSKSRVIPEPR
ncbi:MAG: hypothetical protein QXX08_08230 [Candidatus Bathyarchaeia archaeon]